MSIDGYLDSATEQRLLLSNDADFDRVDAVRAACDAILVGAATVRQRQPAAAGARRRPRRDERVARGLPPSPMKVTVTGRAQLDAVRELLRRRRRREAGLLRERGGGRGPGPARAGRDRGRRRPAGGPARLSRGPLRPGVRRLMVEGGGTVLTQFLTADLADELHLVVAPFFVGDSRARAVRQRRPVPLEPRPAGAPGRGPPDRRRGAAALCALVPIRHRLTEETRCHSALPAATVRTQVTLPLCFADGYATTARVFSFNGLADGREHLAFGLGDYAGSRTPDSPDRPVPLVRPHSECLTSSRRRCCARWG